MLVRTTPSSVKTSVPHFFDLDLPSRAWSLSLPMRRCAAQSLLQIIERNMRGRTTTHDDANDVYINAITSCEYKRVAWPHL